jgi:hypothetical protein
MMPIGRDTPYEALPEFLAPEELGIWLDLRRDQVNGLIRQNMLVHVRMGRTIRVPKRALLGLIGPA